MNSRTRLHRSIPFTHTHNLKGSGVEPRENVREAIDQTSCAANDSNSCFAFISLCFIRFAAGGRRRVGRLVDRAPSRFIIGLLFGLVFRECRRVSFGLIAVLLIIGLRWIPVL